VDCPTFGDDGSFAPAELRVELFRPIEISDPRRDTRRVVESFRDATQRNVGERYPGGVKIRSWRVQMASRRVRSPLASGGRD
jgi:hypothetical protein